MDAFDAIDHMLAAHDADDLERRSRPTAVAPKAWTKDMIKEKLATNAEWQKRALLAIYHRQTELEKRAAATIEHNGVGFNATDSEILSDLALQLIQRGWLSSKQMVIVAKKMPKYSRQLAEIANGGLHA